MVHSNRNPHGEERPCDLVMVRLNRQSSCAHSRDADFADDRLGRARALGSWRHQEEGGRLNAVHSDLPLENANLA